MEGPRRHRRDERARAAAGLQHPAMGGAAHRLHHLLRGHDPALRVHPAPERQAPHAGAGVRQVRARLAPARPPLPPARPANATCLSSSQVLIRSRVLRENGKYIPKQVRSCAAGALQRGWLGKQHKARGSDRAVPREEQRPQGPARSDATGSPMGQGSVQECRFLGILDRCICVFPDIYVSCHCSVF